jgi:hypothetical protein
MLRFFERTDRAFDPASAIGDKPIGRIVRKRGNDIR